MIRYERTLYGFSYLFRCTGSELPRCLPWVIASGIIGGVFASGASDQLGWPIRDYFGHPYAMQVLGLVFGYLSITRLNVSYNRYWEGCSHVKVMHSKWSVAALQLLAFDRVSAHETALRDEPFCMHLIRLFKQLSGVAIMKLHVEDWDHFFAEDEDPAHPALVNPPLARHSDPPSLAESFHGSFHESFIRRTRRASFTEEERLTKKREADVQKLFTPAEADFYRRAPDAASARLSNLPRAYHASIGRWDGGTITNGGAGAAGPVDGPGSVSVRQQDDRGPCTVCLRTDQRSSALHLQCADSNSHRVLLVARCRAGTDR